MVEIEGVLFNLYLVKKDKKTKDKILELVNNVHSITGKIYYKMIRALYYLIENQRILP